MIVEYTKESLIEKAIEEGVKVLHFIPDYGTNENMINNHSIIVNGLLIKGIYDIEIYIDSNVILFQFLDKLDKVLASKTLTNKFIQFDGLLGSMEYKFI